MRWTFTIAICTLVSSFLQAQPLQTTCGTDIVHRQALHDASFLQKHALFEQGIFLHNQSINNPSAKPASAVVTLPVVVHIIHQNGLENISDAQVELGIQHLNEAFANTGYYNQNTGEHTMIQFCLAKRNPDGAATNGITRHVSGLTDLEMETEDEQTKDIDRWTPYQYINIWLVREICSSSSGCGVAGYAYFPTAHGSNVDGIMMEARWLGTSNANSTVLIHEMGHYLGLYHTFEGGCTNDNCATDGDRVCDTPPDNSTAWIPCGAVVNTCTTDALSGFVTDQSDLTRNFMDYADLTCLHDFTPGQSTRMNAVLAGSRKSLLSSKACVEPCPAEPIAAFFPTAASLIVGENLVFTNTSQNASAYTWSVDNVVFSTSTNADYAFLTAGTFTVSLVAQSATPDVCDAGVATALVKVTCPVVASFQPGTTTPVVGEVVQLTNTSQQASTFEWFINGASQGSALNTYIFDEPGTFTILLEAENGFCKSSKTVNIMVGDSCGVYTFQKIWNSTGEQSASQIDVLADGNYLMTGQQGSAYSNANILLCKVSPEGNTIEQFSYGGVRNELAGATLALPDGGWIVAGSVLPNHKNDLDPLIARFSADGVLVWQKTIITQKGSCFFSDVVLTKDAHLAVSGRVYNPGQDAVNGFLGKLDLQTGNLIWGWVYPQQIEIKALVEYPTGGFVACGIGLKNAGVQGTLMRTDPDGNPIWLKSVYANNSDHTLTDIHATAEGDIVAVGIGTGWYDLIGKQDVLMIKTNADGDLSWSNLYRSDKHKSSSALSANIYDVSLWPTNDGGITCVFGDKGDIDIPYMFKTNAVGEILWSRMHSASWGGFLDIAGISDGYLICGWVEKFITNDLWLLRTDLYGYAGPCAERDHTLEQRQIQPLLENTSLIKSAVDALVDIDLPVIINTLASVDYCQKGCIETPPCENTWIKSFKAPGATQGGNNIIRATDGAFLVSGFRADSSLLMKITPAGKPVWTRVFKFTSGAAERINQFIEDSDGNLVGCGMSGNGPHRGFTFRYNPAADQIDWVFENPVDPQTLYYTIQEKTPGGNYLAVNTYYDSPAPGNFEDAHWVEIDRNTGQYVGKPAAFSLDSSEGIQELQERAGNWYVAGGYTSGTGLGSMRASIGCFDEQGYEVWSRLLFFSQNEVARNYATDFVFLGEGLVTTIYGDFDGDDPISNEVAVCSTDKLGNIQWAEKYTLPLNQALTKSIVALPDGYVVLVANQDTTQTQGICLFRIGKKGGLIWRRCFDNLRITSGEKLLAVSDDYLYFTAQHTDSGDLAIAKINLADGRTGSTCSPITDAVITQTSLPKYVIPVNLTRYDSPITQFEGSAFSRPIAMTSTDVCIDRCTPEICNNGKDDDDDNLFDCLDSDCLCDTCGSGQTDTWYFGALNGLDFSTDPPGLLTDGKTDTEWASAVMNDPSGGLLFYTDAQTVFQRNHMPMPNGTGLFGGKTSAQTLVVPRPGNPAEYYIFTADGNLGPAQTAGLSYSKVDMRLNDGLGDIPTDQKNLPLPTSVEVTEQISGTKHCNGTDYWVLNPRRTDNAILAYLVDQNGVQLPPQVSIISPNGVTQAGAGQMKISPGGQFLARTIYEKGVELFQFDPATGLLSDPMLLIAPGLNNLNGVEFSPDGRYVYASGGQNPSVLYQFNVMAGTSAAINASATLIGSYPAADHYGQLQLTKYGKIYVAIPDPLASGARIAIINQPNAPGIACAFEENGLPLTGPLVSSYGLPNFMAQLFWKPTLNIDPKTEIDSICLPASIHTFSLEKLSCGIQSVEWALSGPATIIQEWRDSVAIRFDQQGQMMLIARGTAACGNAADTTYIVLSEMAGNVLDLGPDRLICKTGVEQFDAGPGFAHYRWFNGSIEQRFTAADVPGEYWVEVWDICGNRQSDTIKVMLDTASILDLGPDRSLCPWDTQFYQIPAVFSGWRWYPDAHLSCADCPGVLVAAPATTTYTILAERADGCLYVDSFTIEILADTTAVQVQLAACTGEEAIWNGQVLLPGGPYAFVYNTINGCDSTVLVTVTELDTAQTIVELTQCEGDTIYWNGQALLPGGPYAFMYNTINGCDSTVLVTVVEFDTTQTNVELTLCKGDTINWNGQMLWAGGAYAFVYNTINGCDSTISVTVNELDTAQTNVELTLCKGDTINWNGQMFWIGGSFAFMYNTINGCDSTVLVTVTEFDTPQNMVELTQCEGETVYWNGQVLLPGGPYTFMYNTIHGCDSIVLVTVMEADTVLTYFERVSCGGQAVQWNGQSLLPGNSYVFPFTGLNGCDSTIVVSVKSSPDLTVELPQVEQLALGSSIQLMPKVIGIPPLQYTWTPPAHLSCMDCPAPFADPVSDTWYTLAVTDYAGCTATDSVWIQVNTECKVFFSNIFQPNDDGRDDWFFPQSGPCVRQVRLLRVYSRWGETVFEKRDFSPNEAALGWNGRFLERELNPGVFVWYAEWELIDGRRMVGKGEVTLIK